MKGDLGRSAQLTAGLGLKLLGIENRNQEANDTKIDSKDFFHIVHPQVIVMPGFI